MKLIIQIPCYNEEQTLGLVLKGLPKSIPGISKIETLVIDDGSTDRTSQEARSLGVDHLVLNKRNLGLAHSFRRAIDACLSNGADVIVNIDGDNQYLGSEIEALIQPILVGKADIVVGDRQTDSLQHFSVLKRLLQRLGSAVVRRLSRTKVHDAVSGFRAFSREAAIKTTILSNYTYTIESILQAHTKGLTVVNVPISSNQVARQSRLMRSLRSYLAFSIATILRVFAMYNPLKVFLNLGLVFVGLGSLLGARFIYFYFTQGSSGMVQSLIFAAILLIIGMSIILVGLLADLIQFNRRLLEDILERVRKLELKN